MTGSAPQGLSVMRSDDSADYSDASNDSSGHAELCVNAAAGTGPQGSGDGDDVARRKWNESQRALLTGLSAAEQRRAEIRKRNRHSARRSRQKKKDCVPNLEARLAQLNDAASSFQSQLTTWIEFNAIPPAATSPAAGEGEPGRVEDLNSAGSMVVSLLHAIAELQLLLENIVAVLNAMVGHS
ncbi:hypothetical protein H4R21_002924 [Coemansia helicoidea]|uniref:Uncharacterized protein n=1 Tax=Coemansia helicoidea TaxID=1286919 RepID=A0ACC1L5D4_9FUNG|nr:hypothetical protein H4R21_002924 [Coemansia helicoidea]